MKKSTLLLLSIFVFSCTSNTIFEKPKNLIPKDSMIDLLVDMQLAVGARSGKNLDGKYGLDYMPLVYEKYRIDSARFTESSFYYSTDIDHYTKILKTVKARLKKMNADNELIVEELDSIKKAKNPKQKIIPLKNDSIIK
ncbi:MAG: hypothetical protein COB73_09440 [Flavobacteriaceae bacterium]|nr:MAG: hypothetical protein COB73_09440 [Flavobacteriaceae bacterium]